MQQSFAIALSWIVWKIMLLVTTDESVNFYVDQLDRRSEARPRIFHIKTPNTPYNLYVPEPDSNSSPLFLVVSGMKLIHRT